MVSRSRPSRVVRASGLESSLRAVASSSDVAFRSAIGTRMRTALERVDEGRPVGPVEKEADPGPDDAHERRHDDRRGERERKGVEREDEDARDSDRDRHPDALDGGLHRQPGALREHLVDRVDGGPRRAIGQGDVGDAGRRHDRTGAPARHRRRPRGRDHGASEERQHHRVGRDAQPQAEAAQQRTRQHERGSAMLAAFMTAV